MLHGLIGLALGQADLAHNDAIRWCLLLGIVVAFVLAFSVGANDVSNSFGTSVGAGVLTVTQACILASIFETAGATLLGHAVCDFFRNNMYKVEQYRDSEQSQLMLGALACLLGSAIWNLVATKLKMPISGTHSIIGATLGFSLVLKGTSSIQWAKIVGVVASWFVSPLVSGAISSLIYMAISRSIVEHEQPLEQGLRWLPLIYGATVFINAASMLVPGPPSLKLAWYFGLTLALLVCAVVIFYVAKRVVPKIRAEIEEELRTGKQAAKTFGRKRSFRSRLASIASYVSERRKSSFALVRRSFSGLPQPQPQPADQPAAPKPASMELGPAASTPTKPQVAGKPAALQQLHRQLAQDAAGRDDGADVAITVLAAERDAPSQSGHELDMRPAGAKHAAGAAPTPNQLQVPASGHLEEDLDDEQDQKQLDGQPALARLRQAKMIAGERLEVFRLFSSLQILTACFASFAHGSNDVSNAIAPLVPIWNIWDDGREDPTKATQTWLLFFGAIGICTGLWAWGRAVMKTVGSGLVQLTPAKGFAVELGAAISVLMASKVGLPISTTHCKVGSLVIVGLVSSRYCPNQQSEGVDFKLFGNIALTWVVTVPLAALASAAATVLLLQVAPQPGA